MNVVQASEPGHFSAKALMPLQQSDSAVTPDQIPQ